MPLVLNLHRVTHSFESAGETVTILKNVELNVVSGSSLAVRGPSGCGKSTLLHIAGTLERPSGGVVEILGENPWMLSSSKLASFRNHHIGFVFQEHQLLPQCSVLENVLLPTLAGAGAGADQSLRKRALELLERVGLQHRLTHRPGRLSGGERQRVAVCRALVNRPSLLLADEPTGNLDPVTAQTIGSLLLEMASEHDAALVCVTHSDKLAESFPHTVNFEDGSLHYQDVAATASA
jgi:lipoprotein-releasing system ATP-binding protein